jgi:hypothetical protein
MRRGSRLALVTKIRSRRTWGWSQKSGLPNLRPDDRPTRRPSITSAPGRTRTCDLVIRRDLLYPSELQGLTQRNYPVRILLLCRFAPTPRTRERHCGPCDLLAGGPVLLLPRPGRLRCVRLAAPRSPEERAGSERSVCRRLHRLSAAPASLNYLDPSCVRRKPRAVITENWRIWSRWPGTRTWRTSSKPGPTSPT